MRAPFGRAVLIVSLLGLVSSLSCSADNGGQGSNVVGTVGFKLQIAPGVTINTVNWTVTNATSGFTQSGSVNEQFSNTIQFQIGGLPAGDGYSITLTATSVDGSFTCSGSASFSVTAGMTTTVGITLACNPGAGGNGTVVVNGTTVVCANINSVSVFPLETTVNNSIVLTSTASAGATFAWTASAGTFNDAATANPVFTCPSAPGPVTITLTVSPSAAGCTTVTSQAVTVTCDTLNPTFTNVYANVIGARCTGCHRPGGGGVVVGMLDMSTPAKAYANLVNVVSAGTGAGTSGVTCAAAAVPRVSPGNSAGSLLFEKVNSKLTSTQPPCGSPMPLPATALSLSAAQVNLIAQWIDAGAANN
jgi:hypothetical protein